MITNNLVKAFNQYAKSASTSQVNASFVSTEGQTFSGNISFYGANYSNKFSASLPSSANVATCLFFGTGDTNKPAKKTDYNLDATVAESNFTRGAGSATIQSDGTCLVTQIFTWTSSESATIKEVGLMGVFTGHESALLAREVLENPITVDNDENKYFTISMVIG